MTVELVHIASKERMAPEVTFLTKCISQISITESKVKYSLCFAFNYAHPYTQHYIQSTGSRSASAAINTVTTKNIDASCATIIVGLKVKVAIILCFQLCSTHFTVLQIGVDSQQHDGFPTGIVHIFRGDWIDCRGTSLHLQHSETG